ncbi:MAG: trimeric intracellular cation channel family protein [Alphaproteobacteria bacterium]|nr:trimeric intracellular cation channel family protein [Alphaproteobacteria bacterium]
MLFHALDLGATFVFAISGATQGVRHRLDLFGVLVVAWAAGVAGGIARDLLIGATPPAAIVEWRYLAAAMAAGFLAFFASNLIDRLKTPVLLFDAAGLSLFAVVGTQKALEWGMGPIMSAILGMITCIGGGVARDLLTRQLPVVLYGELYAVAALAGAGSVTLGFWLGLPPWPVIAFGAALCFFLRLMALYRGWKLPIAATNSESSKET